MQFIYFQQGEQGKVVAITSTKRNQGTVVNNNTALYTQSSEKAWLAFYISNIYQTNIDAIIMPMWSGGESLVICTNKLRFSPKMKFQDKYRQQMHSSRCMLRSVTVWAQTQYNNKWWQEKLSVPAKLREIALNMYDDHVGLNTIPLFPFFLTLGFRQFCEERRHAVQLLHAVSLYISRKGTREQEKMRVIYSAVWFSGWLPRMNLYA